MEIFLPQLFFKQIGKKGNTEDHLTHNVSLQGSQVLEHHSRHEFELKKKTSAIFGRVLHLIL